MSDFIKTE